MANKKRRALRSKKKNNGHSVEHKKGRSFGGYFLAFLVGGILTYGLVLAFQHRNKIMPLVHANLSLNKSPEAGKRTVLQLLALSDEELEKVDVLELDLAVSREIKGHEDLDYDHYCNIVDKWTRQFSLKLKESEQIFNSSPHLWKNDIDLFRFGMLASFLEHEIGVDYNEDQKFIKKGRYTNPGDLFLYGLIDTRRGSCANMPTLHVAIGRRMGWPVSLACIGHHFVCRFDNGEKVYSLEATAVGRGGYSIGTDKECIQWYDISEQAIKSGSDLHSFSAREMLGTFIGFRARHYNDIGQTALADSDYSLARWAFPENRLIYSNSFTPFVWRGEQLFEPSESGHPLSFVGFLQHQFGGRMLPVSRHKTSPKIQTKNFDGLAELRRVNALNKARKAQKMQQRQNISTTGKN